MRVNRVGCDHIVPSLNNHRIEVKFQKGVLFTTKGKPKSVTGTVQLMNTMGAKTETRVLHSNFDHLIVVDTIGAALISYSDVIQYTKTTNDQVVAKIPSSALHYVAVPAATPVIYTDTYPHYVDLKEQLMDKYIGQFKESV